jgi:hypothetical protein
MQSEAALLADTFQKVRDLTKWYFSLLKTTDPHKAWEVNGQKLNTAIWTAAHLVWAEDFLIVRSTGGTGIGHDWLEHYKIASDGSAHEAGLEMKPLLTLLNEGHEKAMAHLLTLSDAALDEENIFGFGFGGIKTNRMMIQHCIRHEAMHAGHLSWLCKINGIKAV